MKIYKTSLTNEEYVIDLGDRIIPMSALKVFFNIMIVILIAGLMYMIGQTQALEYIRFQAFLAGEFDNPNSIYFGCEIVQKNNEVIYDCPRINGDYNDSIPFNNGTLNNYLD